MILALHNSSLEMASGGKTRNAPRSEVLLKLNLIPADTPEDANAGALLVVQQPTQ